MASDYGLNFGFRRSDESMRISEGRFRTPVGSQLVLGTAVEIDASSPGYLKQAAKDVEPRPGICGLLVQEEAWDRSIHGKQRTDSFDLNVALPNRLSVITNGAGVKVWFRNTPKITRADGREIAAVTMFDTTDMAVGKQLGWDGSAWAVSATGKFMEVTEYDADKAYFEAVLLV